MSKLAKLASRLNWPHDANSVLPRLFLFTDQNRLPDPSQLLTRLARGTCVVLRHTEAHRLEALGRTIIPAAHRLGLKVLIANDVRLALKLNADGVHLSQKCARQGPLRTIHLPKGFLITAAAHDVQGLNRAAIAGAKLVFVSPVFATASHPSTAALGIWRFYALANVNPLPVAALGGIDVNAAKRLKLGHVWAIAAIDGWRI